MPRVTVRPKAVAGTLPGQAASALVKSKNMPMAAPWSRSWTAVCPPERDQVAGEAEVFQVTRMALP